MWKARSARILFGALLQSSALGPVRARDPMLSIGCTFVALRVVIAVGQLVERGTLDAPWALAAIVVAFLVRRRLRLFERPPTGNVVA